MRAILVYYMVEQLRLDQQRASLIFGLYTAYAFLTPIIGGVLADKWLGRRRSVLIGGAIMAAGHLMMASEPLFYVALVTIATGNGLFLPSLPSQINGLYRPEDPRRHLAYNYYYVGANLGGFLAPLGVGTIGEIFGWHWGFTLAGFGMLAGLVIYTAGQRYLPPDVVEPGTAKSLAVAPTDSRAVLRRFVLLFGVAAMAVIFRTAYEQVGNTLPLWIEGTERHVGSWVIPMTWFQSLNPLFIFLLTPLVTRHWMRLSRVGKEPSSIRKMSVGAATVAVSYLALAVVAAWSNSHHSVASWLWVAGFFALMTAGELYILPVGLGLFGRLSPARYTATGIALWFLAAFGGNLAAGALGMLWSNLSAPRFFCAVAGVATLAAVGLLFFDGAIGRAMEDEG